MESKEKIVRTVVYSAFALSLILVVYYILRYTELFFHSDAAATVLLAKEQLLKKQLLPEGFCYSTGVFVISLANIIAPLMLFIKDWMLCRKLAVIIYISIFFVLIFLFYRKIGIKQKNIYAPFLATILFCLPMGHYKQTFYEAAYVLSMVGELLILLLLFKIISSKKKWTNVLVYYIALFAIGVLWNAGDIRNQVIIMLPSVLSVLLYLFFEYLCTKNNLLNKRIICALATISLAAATGFLIYVVLFKVVGLNSGTAQITFVSNISENIIKFPDILLSFYGATNYCSLISLKGILLCVNFVLCVIATFIAPILSILYYKKIKNSFLKIYIIYIWISNFIVVFMLLFTNMTNVGSGYYQTVFFHNLMIMALLIEYLLSHEIKIVKYAFAIGAIGVTLLSHIVYFRENNHAKQIYETNNEYSLVHFLQDNDLTYGYATFWNAYNNTVLSNGEITIAGVIGGGNTPYYWLTSRDWYNTELYNGRCFYLLSAGETLDVRFYEAASEIKTFNQYTILIFEKNVLEYQFEAVTERERNIAMQELLLGDNSYRSGEQIALKTNGVFKVPTTGLELGTYEIIITGDNIESIAIAGSIEGQDVERSENEIILEIKLEEAVEYIEMKNANDSTDVALIESIKISLKEKAND